MKYVLILILFYNGHSVSQSTVDFESEDLCKAAGEALIKDNNRVSLLSPTAKYYCFKKINDYRFGQD